MRDMQTKVLRAIEKEVEDLPKEGRAFLEVVQRPVYANTGKLLVQPVRGFRTLLTVHYDFQNSDATLFVWGPKVDVTLPTRIDLGTNIQFYKAGASTPGKSPAGVGRHDRLVVDLDYEIGDHTERAVRLIGQLVDEAY